MVRSMPIWIRVRFIEEVTPIPHVQFMLKYRTLKKNTRKETITSQLRHMHVNHLCQDCASQHAGATTDEYVCYATIRACHASTDCFLYTIFSLFFVGVCSKSFIKGSRVVGWLSILLSKLDLINIMNESETFRTSSLTFQGIYPRRRHSPKAFVENIRRRHYLYLFPAIRSKLFASLKGFPLLSGVFLDLA